MADQRITQATVLTDPTTSTQQAGVDSSGNLQTVVNAALPAGTNNIGDVDVLSVIAGVGATNLGKAEDAVHASGDTGVAVWAVRRDTAAVGSGTDGDYSSLNVDASGQLYCSSVLTGTALTAIQSVETAVELIDDAIYTDGSGTPSKGMAVMGSDGTNPQLVSVDSDGHVQVDILSGAGSNTPTNPAVDIPTAATIAAGASDDMDSADLASKKLWMATVSGSVPFKVVLSTLNNSVATPKVTLFGGPGNPVNFTPPHPDFFVSGSSAGADGFRAAVKNLDSADSADFYTSFMYAD